MDAGNSILSISQPMPFNEGILCINAALVHVKWRALFSLPTCAVLTRVLVMHCISLNRAHMSLYATFVFSGLS